MSIQNADDILPNKRKRMLNSKITSEDNVHEDAVKRRKLVATQLTSVPKSIPHTRTRSASVEVVEDEENSHPRNAGRPQDPNAILESVNEDRYESLVEPPSSKKTSALPKKDAHHGSAKRLSQGPQIPNSTQQRTRSASVEVVEDEENSHRRNAGRPRDPSVILESVNEDESESPVKHNPKRKSSTSTKKLRKAAGEPVGTDEEVLQEDADEAELGM